ncbi:DUF4405 domain-containing protein [Rhodoferax sp.]|uniref:DUF4405 domain-containing protein n=1 Tax=Rhodoferax sp. TaxID=50421 RepID=UPI002633F5D0|nr:DUF4405 domain-containing protein [Rhodoferax sp.]MDD2926458.1 DUF4405 domain-containing protein [Rhodoferax sp.]
MNLNAHRHWITPFVIGSFLLMAATGVLMFFHLDTGLNKTAHEWLGWLMLGAVGLHLANNLFSFKRYLNQTTGRLVIGLFALVLGLSFLSVNGSGGKPPFVAPLNALAQAPLSVVAQVAAIPTAQLREKLAAQGIPSQNDNQSIAALVGNDTHKQVDLLAQLFRAQDTNPAK